MAGSVLGNNAFLKVSPAELKNKAQQLQSTMDNMEGQMNQMNSTVSTVSDNWQSTSGDAYAERAAVLIKEIHESLQNLAFYIKDLLEASEKYEELENEISGKVSALDDPSNIFNV